MELYNKKQECCGCGACAAICPKSAITMVKDLYGFNYPQIDPDKCINCKKCLNICAFNKKNDNPKEPLLTYAAVSKDDNLLKASSSGGVFGEVSKSILSSGGVVFGCAYTEDYLSAKHVKVSSQADLRILQGSKYVQSDSQDIFHAIKDCLERGETVLFSGTPCQVASLRSFLGKEYASLYCIDLICHGVGAPALFAEDIKRCAKGKKITKLSFRDKSNGWGTSGRLITEKRNIKFDVLSSPYYYYFLENSLFRDSCYNCRYACEKRVGDITIGDYWRVESAHPEILKNVDVDKGVSCLLVNTEKGKQLVENAFENLLLIPSEYKKVESRNGQLVHCCVEPPQRKEIFSVFENSGYDGVVKYWKRTSKKKRWVLRIKSFIPKKIKIFLKKRVK